MATDDSLFIRETTTQLDLLEELLLELEKQPESTDAIHEAFRMVHTIKGSSGMFGFDNLGKQAHEVENLFERLRSGAILLNPRIIEAVLRCVDRMRIMLDDPGITEDTSELMNVLADELPPKQLFQISFRPHREMLSNGTSIGGILTELCGLGNVQISADLSAIPAWTQFDPILCYVSFSILLVSSETEEMIRDVFMFVEGSSELEIEKMSPEILDGETVPKIGEIVVAKGLVSEQDLESALQEQKFIERHAKKRTDDTLQIDTHKVNATMDLVGEMVTLQARLNQLSREIQHAELTSVAESLELMTADMRERVMSMRLIRLHSVFGSFKRLVRDLARQTGKQVELVIDVGDTEIDKNVMDKLKDPIMHLLRNSVDHGIEPPDGRIAAGKPATARVTLSACYVGSQIRIELTDDGRGIDVSAIQEQARRRNIQPMSSTWHEEDILRIISTPGFSTAAQVSDLSGRGVGMDVLRQAIQNLDGHISLKTEVGRYTSFQIQLPITLAIIDSLLVRVENSYFTVQVKDISECFILHTATHSIDSPHQLFNLNGEPLPLINLRSFMEMGGDPPDVANVAVIGSKGSKVGVIVDEIVGKRVAAIKPRSSQLQTSEAIVGSTILSDGKISFVLDAAKLLEAAQAARPEYELSR